jgi:phosphoglycolate phosphatase-like HAD superfamily hydrolase
MIKELFHRKPRKYIFFDFDGTICDAREAGYQSFCRVMDEYGCRADKKLILSLMGTKLEHMLKAVGLNPGHIDSARRKFYSYFKKEVIGGGIKLCVSIKPLWELSKEYNLVLISHSETPYIKKAIIKLKLKGLFKKIYGAEKYGSKDKLLVKLMKKYKLDPKKTIYIGDRYSDVEYAKKAGCVSVAINNSCAWSDIKTIRKVNPDYIIKDFHELKKICKILEL